jgi:hypothetical protein
MTGEEVDEELQSIGLNTGTAIPMELDDGAEAPIGLDEEIEIDLDEGVGMEDNNATSVRETRDFPIEPSNQTFVPDKLKEILKS